MFYRFDHQLSQSDVTRVRESFKADFSEEINVDPAIAKIVVDADRALFYAQLASKDIRDLHDKINKIQTLLLIEGVALIVVLIRLMFL